MLSVSNWEQAISDRIISLAVWHIQIHKYTSWMSQQQGAVKWDTLIQLPLHVLLVMPGSRYPIKSAIQQLSEYQFLIQNLCLEMEKTSFLIFMCLSFLPVSRKSLWSLQR